MDGTRIFTPQELRVKFHKVYLFVAAIILILARIGQTIGLQKPAAFLENPSSLFDFITNRQLLLGVAFMEIFIAMLLISPSFELVVRNKILFWLASLFAIYRLILWMSGEPEPCRCFCRIFDWIHLDDSVVDYITTGLFLFLFIPSGVLVLLGFKKG